MNDPLLSLAPSELRTLAASVRAGRVTIPYSALNLQQILGEARASDVAKSIGVLATSGMSPEALVCCLELAADALDSRPSLENLVDLVTTGPEAGGVANRSTAVVVSELFRNAQNSVLIAGYAVYQGRKVFEALAQRMLEMPELQVRMFLDVPRKQSDTSSPDALIAKFVHQFKTSEWPTGAPWPQVYCCKQFLQDVKGKCSSLHAKCIVVDNQQVFVSSANFTEAAQERNVEIGLLIGSTVLGHRVRRFFDALVDAAFLVRIL